MEPDEDVSKIKNKEMQRIWRKLFPVSQSMIFVEYVETDAMLEWLRTEEGKKAAINALHEFPEHVCSIQDIL